MILLVLAIICLGGAIYMIGQLRHLPAAGAAALHQARLRLRRGATRQILDATEESLKTRS